MLTIDKIEKIRAKTGLSKKEFCMAVGFPRGIKRPTRKVRDAIVSTFPKESLNVIGRKETIEAIERYRNLVALEAEDERTLDLHTNLKSLNAIAEATGVSIPAVKAHLHRAKVNETIKHLDEPPMNLKGVRKNYYEPPIPREPMGKSCISCDKIMTFSLVFEDFTLRPDSEIRVCSDCLTNAVNEVKQHSRVPFYTSSECPLRSIEDDENLKRRVVHFLKKGEVRNYYRSLQEKELCP